MEFETVLRGRRSVRAYTDEAVSDELIGEILDEARWSPSSAQHAGLERLGGHRQGPRAPQGSFQAGGAERGAARSPTSCRPPTGRRRARCARGSSCEARTATLAAAGLDTDPATALARMADLFGAPCLLVFGVEECLGESYALLDTGLLVQSVCLAAFDRGLGTCIVATIVRHPELLRELLPGSEGKRMAVGVALRAPRPLRAGQTPLNAPARLSTRS